MNLAALVALSALAFLLTACGGGGDSVTHVYADDESNLTPPIHEQAKPLEQPKQPFDAVHHGNSCSHKGKGQPEHCE